MLGEGIGAPIIDSDKKLAEELFNLSYSMFCYHKQNKKTFTVCNNRKLRNMRIQEDADGFSDADNFVVTDFIKKNLLDVFVELVSYSYLPRVQSGAGSQLFVSKVYSRYSGNEHTVFFVNINDDVYIFNEKLTTTKLSDYISNYFSASTAPDIEIQEVREIATSRLPFSQKQRKISLKVEEFNRNVINKHGFIWGAITFLDFLAWKGLWQSQDEHNSLREVSDLIEDFRHKLAELSQEYFTEAEGVSLSSLISISDTIAVFTPKTSGAKVHDLLKIHAYFSKYVLEACCTKKYPIRGAIAYGEYSTMKNIMIGPGIDECASWHETGNWIGVHLTPTAQLHWDDAIHSDDIICSYDVPLKKGLKASYCVQWNVSKEIFKELAQKRSRALLPEISSKYMNTQKFLKERVWKEETIDGKK